MALTTKEIALVAGSGERGSQDGAALDATFNSPNGIAATGEGKVFVHDINPRAESDGVTVDLRNGSLRVVSLPSLTGELSDMYVAEGAEAMVEAYNRYRADPATAWLFDEAEMMGWGEDTLPVLPEAGLRIFQLNVESYPSSWRAQEALGDAYVTVGQPAEAIAAFERSLELNPDNASAAEKLQQIRAPRRR